MRLFLVRHGAYQSIYSSERGPALSALGREQATAVGHLLKTQNAKPELLITSGYLRATETASCILRVLGTTCNTIEDFTFNPAGDPEEMKLTIEAANVKDLLVVGHLSSIAHLAHLLDSKAPPTFGYCTIAAFDFSNGAWKFLWAEDSNIY